MGQTPARSSSEQYGFQWCARPMFLAGCRLVVERGDTFFGPSSSVLCLFLTIEILEENVVGMRQ